MTTAPTAAATRRSPYKGLLPYAEADAERFFGRESEASLVVSNLRARRLTLLYGESGVGKSSLLRAGVVPELRAHARRELRERGRARAVPIVFDVWRDDPVASLIAAVGDQAAEFLPDQGEVAGQLQHLDEALELWSSRLDAKLLLVLDQFEEYFLYHPAEEGAGTLVDELPRPLMRSDVPVNVLISIREDALAKLDGFRSRIPDLMANRLRIRHLDRRGAREAIEKPLEYFNERNAADVSIEPELVEAVLHQVEAGKVQLDGAGLGEVAQGDGRAEARIEAPYLQLVMERLWDVEMASGSSRLRLETLERLGGSQTIVRTHLDEVLSGLVSERQDEAAEVFRYLVTRGGTKIAYSAADLAELVGRPETEVQRVLQELDDVRILRTVDGANGSGARYEIFHDVLAAAVLDWRQRYGKEEAERQAREARQAEERERRKARTFRFLLAVASVLLLIAAGAAVFAFVQRASANRARETFASAAVGRRASGLLGTRPDVAMLAALEAYRLRETPDARSAILAGLHGNAGLPALLVGHFRSVNDVAFSPNSELLASVGWDGSLRLWSVDSNRPLAARVIAIDAGMTDVLFVDSRTLVTADGEGVLRLWDVSDPRRLRGRGAAVPTGAEIQDLAFSPRRRVLAAASGDRIRFWRVGERLVPLRRGASGVSGVLSLAFSPDGSRLASAESTTKDAGTVSLWDVSRLAGTAPLRRSTVEQPGADSVAFGGAGNTLRLASGRDDGAVVLWNVAGGELRDRKTLHGHLNAVYGLAFSADGSVLASAAYDDTLLVWDVARRRPFGGPRVHAGDVNAVALSGDGRFIASAGDDNLVKLWRVGGPSLATTLRTAADVNWNVATGPRSSLVVAGDSLRLWNLDDVRPEGLGGTASQRRPLGGRTFGEYTYGLSASGDVLAATTWDDVTLGRWPPSGQLQWPTETKKPWTVDKPWSVALAPNSRVLAVGSRDGEITLWDVSEPTEPKRRRTIRAHRGWVYDFAFTPDGSVLASGGEDGAVRLWRVADPARASQLGSPLAGHDRHEVISLAFSPDGRTLATGGRDQRIALWDTTDVANPRRINLPFQEQSNTILALAFSNDGKLLAAGDADEDVVLWDVERREALGGGLAAHTVDEEATTPVSSGDDPGMDALAFDERGFLITAGRHVPVVVWSPELWSDDYETLRRNVCAIVRRPLSEAEWRHFFAETPFEREKPTACAAP